MNKNEFKKEFLKALQEAVPQAEFTPDAVVDRERGSSLCMVRLPDVVQFHPLIDLDQYFVQYQDTEDMEQTVQAAVNFISRDKRDDLLAPEQYECRRNKLLIRLHDAKAKVNLPHVSVMGGLFQVSFLLDCRDEVLGRIWPVTEDLLFAWSVSLEQVYADAMERLKAMDAELVESTEYVFSVLFGRFVAHNYLSTETQKLCGRAPFTLKRTGHSNIEIAFGASLILRPEILKRIGELAGGHYFILPSSVHEVMIVPEESGNKETLEEIVSDANQNERVVRVEDVFTNGVYVWSDGTLKKA